MPNLITAFPPATKHLTLWLWLGLIIVSTPEKQPSAAPRYVTDCDRFGVVEQLSWRFLYPSEETLLQALAMMQQAGVQWVRLNWSWKDFQPQPGPFDYSQFDPVAQAAAEHDIHLVPILMAVPAWASTAPPELIAEKGNLAPVDRYRSRELDDWLLYVGTVVERYDGDGYQDAPASPRLRYWQIWNEPNLALFWPPQPDVNEYLELLAATYETIKRADPTALVVLGGLSGSGVNAENTGFLQQLYQQGGAQYIDVVSIHHYLHPTTGRVDDLQAALRATRRVMGQHGDADTPLWLTEIGWSDAPQAWGQPTASPEAIAEFLKEVYTAPLEVEKIFWYNFRNLFDASSDVEHNFGLIQNDFTPKPAFQAYAEVAGACR